MRIERLGFADCLSLEIVGEKDNFRRLAEAIGFIEQGLENTDLATFAFGMIGGILIRTGREPTEAPIPIPFAIKTPST